MTGRWRKVTLRGLLVIVLAAAIAMGAWVQQGRWWTSRLKSKGKSKEAWSSLLRLNEFELTTHLRGKPRNIWWDKTAKYHGWVWVRTSGNALVALSPNGEILDRGGIVANGNNVRALWSGVLPDGAPGIVLFVNEQQQFNRDGYLMFVSAHKESFVRLLVEINDLGARAKLIPGNGAPTVELVSADGARRERFTMRHGARTWVVHDDPADAPWRTVMEQ